MADKDASQTLPEFSLAAFLSSFSFFCPVVVFKHLDSSLSLFILVILLSLYSPPFLSPQFSLYKHEISVISAHE